MSTLLILCACYVAGAFLVGLPLAKLKLRVYWSNEAIDDSFKGVLFPGWILLKGANKWSPRNYDAYYNEENMLRRAAPDSKVGQQVYIGTWMCLWLLGAAWHVIFAAIAVVALCLTVVGLGIVRGVGSIVVR